MMSRSRKILTLVTTAALGLSTGAAASPGARGPTPAEPRSTTATPTPAPAATPTPAPAAQEVVTTPMVTANGRPACGNVLSKGSGPSWRQGRRQNMRRSMAKLATMIEKGADRDPAQLVDRDQLIRSIRHDLEQLEACDTPSVAVEARPLP
jgi:hypothetical protein